MGGKLMMNSNGLIQLKTLIDQLAQDLVNYSKSPLPKQSYIDKQNKHIQQLVDIYNKVSQLKEWDCWLNIENIIQDLEKRDPCLSGHTIQIRTRLLGNNFSRIIYNPTK